MMKLAYVALQVRFDLAQAPRTSKLPMQHCDKMGSGLDAARIAVGAGFIHSPIEYGPWNVLQKVLKNDSLVSHGVDPFSVQMIRNQLKSSRINAVRFLKHKLCRTPVGQAGR